MPLPGGQISANDLRRFCAVGDNVNYYPAPISLNDQQVRTVRGKSSGQTHSFTELRNQYPVAFPYHTNTCRVTKGYGPPDVYTGPLGYASYVGGSWGSISRNTDSYFFEGSCTSGVRACLMGVFMGRGGNNFSNGYFYVIFGGNRVDADDYEYFRISINNPYSGGASSAMTFPRSSASVSFFSSYNQTQHSWANNIYSQQDFNLVMNFNGTPYVTIQC